MRLRKQIPTGTTCDDCPCLGTTHSSNLTKDYCNAYEQPLFGNPHKTQECLLDQLYIGSRNDEVEDV